MVKIGDKIRMRTVPHTTGTVVRIHDKRRFCIAMAEFKHWDKYQDDYKIYEAFVMNPATGELANEVDCN